LKKVLWQHPHFPSLASLKDILTDCNIKTIAARGSIEKLAGLPLPALVFLTIDNGIFAPVRKVTANQVEWYHTQKGWQNDSLYEFEQKWSGAILLIETSADSNEKNYKIERIKELLTIGINPVVLTGILVAIGLLLTTSHPAGLEVLLILKLIGVALSSFLIKQSANFSPKSILRPALSLIQKRSRIKNLQNEKQLPLVGSVSWAEIGVLYFGTGMLAICGTLVLRLNVTDSLLALNILALPFTLYLVYQLLKAGTWCVWCNVALLIFWLEFAAGSYMVDDFSFPDISSAGLLLASGLFVSALYAFVKPFVIAKIGINDALREVKKMKYSPPYMEGILKNKNQIPPVFENMKVLGIGDPSARHVVTIVYSPCTVESAEMHMELRKLQSGNSDVYWRIILLATSLRDVDIIKVMLNCPTEKVHQCLDSWFPDIHHQSVTKWKATHAYASLLSDEVLQGQMTLHAHWCKLAKIMTVPSLFIDGASIPAVYQVHDIPILLDLLRKMQVDVSTQSNKQLERSS